MRNVCSSMRKVFLFYKKGSYMRTGFPLIWEKVSCYASIGFLLYEKRFPLRWVKFPLICGNMWKLSLLCWRSSHIQYDLQPQLTLLYNSSDHLHDRVYLSVFCMIIKKIRTKRHSVDYIDLYKTIVVRENINKIQCE